jgi:hypothetical protein
MAEKRKGASLTRGSSSEQTEECHVVKEMIEARVWLVSLLERVKSCPKVLREIIYGMTVHEMDLELRKERGNLDHLFMLTVFGDLVGLPLLPPYYSMRLLPFIIPSLQTWKRSVLREKDLTDFVAADI